MMIRIAMLLGLLAGLLVSAGKEGLTLHHLANEGVVLSGGRQTVVVDFPFVVEADWCVGPKPEQIAALVKQALKAHPQAVLIGTQKVIARLKAEAGDPITNSLFPAIPGKFTEWPGVRVEALKAPHAKYWDIDPTSGQKKIYDDGYIHVAYHVTLDGHSFIHGGDAHEITLPTQATAELLLLDRGVLHSRGVAGLRELHERLHARCTLLMHIGPAEEEVVKKLIVEQTNWLTVLVGRGTNL